MGLFGSKEPEAPARETAKLSLKPRDGKLHVLMMNTWNTWGTAKFRCDDKYIGEVDDVLSYMQDEGYEIVKIEHTSLSDGTGFGVISYTTLVTYR